jgi:ElaB/YqjD/DUF883 family membrane-anchored ribosome-binding protein
MSNTERLGPRAAPLKNFEAELEQIATRGAAAIRSTKAGFDDVARAVSDKGQEAMESAREARDTIADTIRHSIKVRPYTTLAIAGFIGFLYGAMRRR